MAIPDSLRDCRIKIEWADEHIRNLEAAISTFVDTRPCEMRMERDPQNGDIAAVIGKCKAIPDSLCLLTADILNSLRSALDYLARQLVIANHQVPSRRCGFPIFLDFALFESMHRRMIDGMSLSAQTNIKALQPFNPGPGENSLLWALHELNNADKHHFPLTITAQAKTGTWKATIFKQWAGVVVKPDAGTAMVEIKEGAKLDLGISANPGVNVQMQISFPVLLPKVGNSIQRELISTLTEMHGMTEGVIHMFLNEVI